MTIGKIATLATLLLAVSARLLAADETSRPRLAAPSAAATTSNVAQSADHNVVLFAGRTVELSVPAEWTVKEVPLGREIRLIVGPGNVPDDPRQLQRGMWLAYHRLGDGSRLPLEAELQKRLLLAAGQDAYVAGPPQATRVGGMPALKQRLEIRAAKEELPRRGTYLIVQTPWGLLETLGITTLFGDEDVRAGLQSILASLRFRPPRPLPAASSDDTRDAQAILGSWKSSQGSMHLLPCGQVRLEADRVTTVTLRGQPAAEPQAMTGRFVARGDVLYITWADGSQLNYRWAIEAGDLLLVDHAGESSRLKRLFDSAEPSVPAAIASSR